MLLYLQNSRQLNSNISRNTSERPSLHASVSGVSPALFTMPFFAGNLGCLSWEQKHILSFISHHKNVIKSETLKRIQTYPIYRQPPPCEESYSRMSLEHLDRRQPPAVNYKPTHCSRTPPTPAGTRPSKRGLHSRCSSPACCSVDRAAGKNAQSHADEHQHQHQSSRLRARCLSRRWPDVEHSLPNTPHPP